MTARFVLFFWCLITIVPTVAADFEGLHEQTKIRISSEMVGSPIPGSLPPSVWAVAFSADQQQLAVGVEFLKKKTGNVLPEDEKSYLLIFNSDRPDVVVKKFAIPKHPAMTVYPKVRWSPDGKYIATPFYRDWDHAAIVDLYTDEVHIIPNHQCHVVGLMAGPEVVQDCSFAGADSRIRFVDKSGTILRDWTFTDYAQVLDVSSDGGKIALHFSKRGSADRTQNSHDIVILDAVDRSESRHWSLASGEDTYFGTFLKSGTEFCVLQDTIATSDREFVCWDVRLGGEILHTRLATGFGPRIIGAGNRLGLEHYDVTNVPKWLRRLAETSFVSSNPSNSVWDLQLKREIAKWPTKSWVPVWTISPDGDTIAEGGSGIVTIYRLAR